MNQHNNGHNNGHNISLIQNKTKSSSNEIIQNYRLITKYNIPYNSQIEGIKLTTNKVKNNKQGNEPIEGIKLTTNKVKNNEQGIEPIEESDILFQDELACILKPDVKKGIIVWTRYTPPQQINNLCDLGLKTGKQLESEGVKFTRRKVHPYIFFRAPYYSRKIDYSTVETEINSSYDDLQFNREKYIYIRVDPDKTFVFSSEIRACASNPDIDIYKSKKLLSEYLTIINDNAKIMRSLNRITQRPIYHLFSSRLIPININREIDYPFDNFNIERHSEILVQIPHLEPHYFVLCT